MVAGGFTPSRRYYPSHLHPNGYITKNSRSEEREFFCRYAGFLALFDGW